MKSEQFQVLFQKIRRQATPVRLLVALIACLVIIAAWLIFWPRSDDGGGDVTYDIRAAQTDLSPTHVFSVKDVDWEVGSKIRDERLFTVYSDAALTQIAAFAEYDPRTSELRIPPPPSITRPLYENRDSSPQLEWGLQDRLYLVQKADIKSGEMLKQTIVTPFTIKRPVSSPEVIQAVTPAGNLSLSWQPVAGASKYYIISVKNSTYDTGRSKQFITKIDETTGTSWESSATDKPGIHQNSWFFSSLDSEDAKRDPSSQIDSSKAAPSGTSASEDIAVVAVQNDQFSTYHSFDADLIRPQLPLSLALNANEELNGAINRFPDVDKIPTAVPVTMADGKTLLKSILLQPDAATIGDILVGGDGAAATVREPVLRVPYIISGTKLAQDYLTVRSFNPATYRADLQRVAKRNIDAQAATGQSTQYKYTGAVPDLAADLTASKAKPQVPYQINASNDFTAFLAAHLVKGTEYIDISQYLDKAGSPQLDDAFLEALKQNPFIVDFASYFYYADKKVLRMYYLKTDAADRRKEQDALNKAADRIVQEVASKGSDRDKALAINNYLVKNSAYDYAALDAVLNAGSKQPTFYGKPRSFTAAGILIDKLGVCSSYASAFKLLADKAGLQSIYVSGVALGSNHAWNKVKFDGKWQVVDATWNHSGGEPQKYFGLSDKQASESRLQGKSFMADPYIERYDAPPVN